MNATGKIALVCWMLSCETAAIAEDSAYVTRLKATLARIDKGANGEERREVARELADVAREHQSEPVPPEIVMRVTERLRDPHDGVRFWIAVTLGRFGPQAKSAVPALERALREAQERKPGEVGPSLGPDVAIGFALSRILGRDKAR